MNALEIKVVESELCEMNGFVHISRDGKFSIVINRSVDNHLKQLLIQEQIKYITMSIPTCDYMF